MNRERADQLIPLLRLQPGIIHNNRLGVYPGDTDTPEQEIPATGIVGRDWETCMTMNDTWGYKSYDQDWKSPSTIVRNLVDIASKGGNYLLNVGPTSEGLIPEPSVERLRAVGKWMAVNGEAIYGTSASPFKKLPWGRCTKKATADGASLFLHVFDWPEDGKLLVPGLRNAIGAARLLADPSRALGIQAGPEGATVSVPEAAPDAISSTIALEVKGPLEIEQVVLAQRPDGSVELPAIEATLHGSLRYESGPQRDNIGFWLDAADWVEWQFKVTKPGKFAVTATVAAPEKTSFETVLGSQTLRCEAPVTGDYGAFKTVAAGTLEIGAAGKATLSVKAVAAGWKPMNLKGIGLKPLP
jgi:alpha-L-fucosidase